MIRANTALKNLHSNNEPSVHNCTNPDSCPTSCATISLQQLKKFEECCLQKKLLPPRPHDVLPAWFLADTEKNIFLWKNSKQLANSADFEFWVDVPSLVDKRVKQITSFEASNPFAGALESQQKEIDYLKSLVALMQSAETHLNALGEVQEQVLADLQGMERAKKIVIPAKINKL